VSKIEDALNKARADGSNLSQARHDIKTLENPLVAGVLKNAVKKTSSSLIKLMKQDAEISDEELINKGIILPDTSRSKVTDSFRHLRTQLLQKSKNENFIVLVTSVAEGSDSSFVSMNMGAAFSFEESKTSLVIDCDIKSHKLEDMLGLEYEYGLLDFLESDIDTSEILKDVGIKRLRIIPSGQKKNIENEFFTTEKMKRLLDDLVDRYNDRYVVLNAPSIMTSADTNILIELVDYVVVVVPYGRVTNSDLEMALRKIDKEKLIGVVLNDVPGWS